MMKKAFALLLAALLVCSLTACGSGNNNGGNNNGGNNNGGNNNDTTPTNGNNDSNSNVSADSIAGKWKVSKVGFKEGGEVMYAAVETYTLVYEFAEDGTYYEHFTQDGQYYERIEAESMKASYAFEDGKLTVTQVWNDTLLDSMRASFPGKTDEEIRAANAVTTEYTVSFDGNNLKLIHSADGVETYWIAEPTNSTN